MLYRDFGQTGVKLSALGIGTNRFRVNNTDDDEQIAISAEVVSDALALGVNYIDTTYSYSKGTAYKILRKALVKANQPFHITVKASYDSDKTADDVLYRVEDSLKALGLEKATFFLAWSIMNHQEFEAIMAKGGLYEGALRAKDRGLIDHICFSTHAPIDDVVRIVESGAFAGVTISYSLLNYSIMDPILQAAKKQKMGVIAMNSLGGGVIVQNEGYFDFARYDQSESIAQAALRFAYAHPAMTTLLSGMATKEELADNIGAFETVSPEDDQTRISRVEIKMSQQENFCTGCRYCDGCPAGIPVYAFMQSANALLLPAVSTYNRNDESVLHNIALFRKLKMDFGFVPEDIHNPCIRCGRCEEKCTQKLPIIKQIADIYRRSKEATFSEAGWKQRLDDLLHGKGYKTVGFYPGGGYSAKVMALYQKFWGKLPFDKCYLFDSNQTLWGQTNAGLTIHAPEEIGTLKPDLLLITSFNYGEEIYQSVQKYSKMGIVVKKLHQANDVPWIF